MFIHYAASQQTHRYRHPEISVDMCVYLKYLLPHTKTARALYHLPPAVARIKSFLLQVQPSEIAALNHNFFNNLLTSKRICTQSYKSNQ
jgi:hypothetical protein